MPQHSIAEIDHSGDEREQAGELVARRGRRSPAILPWSERFVRAAHQRLITSTAECSSWAAFGVSRAGTGDGRAVYTIKTARARLCGTVSARSTRKIKPSSCPPLAISRPSGHIFPRGKSSPPRAGPPQAHRAQKVHNEPLRNAAIMCECNRDANFTPFARTVTALTLGASYALSRRSTPVHEQNERSHSSYDNRR